VPLKNRHGTVLGSFCIMDDAPREVSAADLELLGVMAEQLMQNVEVRRMMEAGAAPAPVQAPAQTSAQLTSQTTPQPPSTTPQPSAGG
jgi:GAF domain-containing protein